MDKKQYIPTKFSGNFDKVNDEFVKCTIVVNSYDQIANGTKFRKEAIEQALPTLNYTPVIGYFKEGDFSNHGIEYVIDNDGIREVVHTVPFGVCIKDSYRWEKIQKDNGEYEDCVVVDCYLWGRYKDAVDVIKENKCNQSMEVNITSYDSSTSDYYDITGFTYSALCILSEDCQPAFTLAKIRTSDKFAKDEFKVCYEDMIGALDKFLNFEEGGNSMDNNEFAKKKKKCSACEHEFESEEFETITCPECGAEITVEDDDKDEDFTNKTDDKFELRYELSHDDIRCKLYDLLRQDEPMECYRWICATYDTYFVYQEEVYENSTYVCKWYKQSYTLEENNISFEGDRTEVFMKYLTQEEINKLDADKQEYENKINEVKSQYTDIQGELEVLRGEYSVIEIEVKELREYKSNIEFEAHKVEVDERLSTYSELETIEGYSDLIKDRYDCDIDALEKEIKVFAYDNSVIIKKSAKKNFSKEKETLKIPVVTKSNNIPNASAWDILSGYIKK